MNRLGLIYALSALAPLLSATPAAAEDASPYALEEIIVTAQKREQRIQDVPIAVPR